MQKYVEFSKEPEGLVIVLRPEKDIEEDVRAIVAKEIDADSQLAEVIEWQLCNGWEFLRPEEVGALTDAPILSDDVERDNQGKVIHVGNVYWWPQYDRFDPVEQLLEKGTITFMPGEDNR